MTQEHADKGASSGGEAAVALEAVDKTLGGRPVLDGFSLEVPEGGTVCLFGPSGIGKTTVLRIAAGLTRPDRGRVWLAGRAVDGAGPFVPPERRGLGMVFQDLALWPHMRAKRQLAYVLRARGVPWRARRQRVRALLELIELSGRSRAYPADLSGGEQQRLAFARALITEPRVLLLDEPFSNLDARLRQRLAAAIAERQRSRGLAVLAATHDPADVALLGGAVCDMTVGTCVAASEFATLRQSG